MRLGRFIVCDSLKGDSAIKGLLAEMDVRREEPGMSVAGTTEYLAEFSEFDDLAEGQMIPQYEFVFTRNSDGSFTRETVKS